MTACRIAAGPVGLAVIMYVESKWRHCSYRVRHLVFDVTMTDSHVLGTDNITRWDQMKNVQIANDIYDGVKRSVKIYK